MDTLHALYLMGAPLGSFLIDFAKAVVVAMEPTVVVVAPLAITAIARRYVRNKELADAIATGAGYAYAHIGSVYAANGKADFEIARKEAVAMGSHALADLALKQIEAMAPDEIKTRIDGSLGRMLAADPAFNVTAPVLTAAVGQLEPLVATIKPGMSDEDVRTLQNLMLDRVRTAVAQGMADNSSGPPPRAGLK